MPEDETPQLPESVRDLFDRDASIAQGDARRVVLGSDGGGSLVASPEGAVRWISSGSPDSSRFVNSSEPLFVDFLLAVGGLRDRIIDVDDDRADQAIRRVYRELVVRDSLAFADSECYWAVVFEQLVQGLL